MTISEVKTSNDQKEFIRVATIIYKNIPNWIRPLDKDIQSVFNPKTNKSFRKGEVIRWILKKDDKLIGRIAAFFINSNKVEKNNLKVGGCGFFECVNDQEAANLLFDTSKKWLKEKGYNSMDGPINFGERDKWWGCLAEGFHIEPNYLQNYGREYYSNLFENYGFKTLFKQLTFLKKVRTPLSEKLNDKAEKALRDPNYSFRTLEKRNIDKYIADFRKTYNEAWSRYPGVSLLKKAQAQSIFNQLKPILDEKICWFAYYNEEPVGFFICIPDMNQIFKHVNGKFGIIEKIKTFYQLKIKKSCKKMIGLVFGIVPKHQGKGVDGALIMASRETIQEKLPYRDLELNWIPDFNKSMIRVAEQVQVELGKTHHTYRYNFDKSIPVERIWRNK